MNRACATAPPVRPVGACALTHVAALAAAVIGQACAGGVVAADHAPVVVDDGVQVVAGQLLLFLTDTELAQVQVPAGPAREWSASQQVSLPAATTSPDCRQQGPGSPDGKLHQVVDLVTPDEAAEGEALELHDEHVGQAPQQQLLGGLAVLFALRAVPERGWGTVRGGRAPGALAPHLPATLASPSLLGCQHLRPCEEVEALVQREVAGTGSLTGRPRVLGALQLLGGHQHELLQALVVAPDQGQAAVVSQVQWDVSWKRAGRGVTLLWGAAGPIHTRAPPPAGLNLCPLAAALGWTHQFCR